MKAKPDAKAHMASVERTLTKLLGSAKETSSKTPAASSPKSAASASQGNQSTAVNGAKSGTRFNVLSTLESDEREQQSACDDHNLEWGSDSDCDKFCGVNFPVAVEPAPAAVVSYFSALAGKAKSFVSAVSSAASAMTGLPRPARYAVQWSMST